MKRLFVFTLIAMIISGCQSHQPINLTVAAAASLSDAMKELNTLYEKEHPETDVTLNLASSGVLANQIKQGAPIDVFLSASESHFQSVQEEDLLMPDYQTRLLRNQLVLIKSRSSELTNFDQLASEKVSRVAIGTPETVPAGAYAKEALQFADLWDSLEDELIFGKDVRQVLTYVETGNADAGIVYETDYRSSKNIDLVEEISEQAYSPIIYPAGVLRGANEEATNYYSFLQSKEAKAIFEKYGFQSDVSTDD